MLLATRDFAAFDLVAAVRFVRLGQFRFVADLAQNVEGRFEVLGRANCRLLFRCHGNVAEIRRRIPGRVINTRRAKLTEREMRLRFLFEKAGVVSNAQRSLREFTCRAVVTQRHLERGHVAAALGLELLVVHVLDDLERIFQPALGFFVLALA